MIKYCKHCYKNTEHVAEEYWMCKDCGANNYKIEVKNEAKKSS